jgi:hypothetical protein
MPDHVTPGVCLLLRVQLRVGGYMRVAKEYGWLDRGQGFPAADYDDGKPVGYSIDRDSLPQ